MKALFEILPADFDSDSATLSCESSTRSFSYAVKSAEDVIISAGVYHFDKNHPDPGNPIALQILFHHHPVLSRQFKHVCIVFAVEESVLIPSVLYNSRRNEEVLQLMHGDVNAGGEILQDQLREMDLYNVYRVNPSIFNILKERFNPSTHIHQYSRILKANSSSETNCLKVIFYSYKMVVALFVEGICKLINTYAYQSPEDVSYMLLNICSQFDAKDVSVEIGGMIEKNSSLYEEINKYFQHVSLLARVKPYRLSEDFTKYPEHFFTHIFAFELCES